MYQVIGRFTTENSPTLCWGGKTSRRAEAQQRLREAEEYAARQRLEYRGQPIKWWIEDYRREANG